MVEILQIDAHTWRMEDGFVRFFLLEGQERSALIDSGVDCPDAAGLAGRVTDKPLLLLNTHGDGDHTSGTGGFDTIHIHPLDYRYCGLGERYPHTSLAEIRDGDEIGLGGRTLRIIHIPGHTKGSVAVLDRGTRTLYAGDSVQTGHIYMFGEKRCPDEFGHSLDRLTAMKDSYDRIYASHGEFQIPNDYAEKVKRVWEQVRNGELDYEEMDLHGTRVRSYTAPACGFYMGAEEESR